MPPYYDDELSSSHAIAAGLVAIVALALFLHLHTKPTAVALAAGAPEMRVTHSDVTLCRSTCQQAGDGGLQWSYVELREGGRRECVCESSVDGVRLP